MKLKADNLGCGECRMKAVGSLVANGAEKVTFDMVNDFILIEPGTLSREECIKLIEKESIYIERDYSENLIFEVELDALAVKELSMVLGKYAPEFKIKENQIVFHDNPDPYDIEELIEIYGYHVTSVLKPH